MYMILNKLDDYEYELFLDKKFNTIAEAEEVATKLKGDKKTAVVHENWVDVCINDEQPND